MRVLVLAYILFYMKLTGADLKCGYEILTKLLENYDSNLILSKPITVNVSFEVYDIKKIDELEGSMEMQSMLVVTWQDPNLVAQICDTDSSDGFKLNIPSRNATKIWEPPTVVTSVLGTRTANAPKPLSFL